MSLIMTKQEREAFLADVHVGVIRISDEARGPLAVPIWYAYDLGGDMRIMTGRESRKGRLLRAPADLVYVCRRKVRHTNTSALRVPSFPLKRRTSSTICAATSKFSRQRNGRPTMPETQNLDTYQQRTYPHASGTMATTITLRKIEPLDHRP